MANKALDANRIIGTHYIIDLFDCDPLQTDSPAILQTILRNSLEDTEITLVTEAAHKFEPHGVTGFVLLSTSHISLHSWPEYGYMSIDVYSCSAAEITRKIVDYLIAAIRHKRMIIRSVDRAYALPSRHNDLHTSLTLPIYKGGKQLLHVDTHVETVNSPFQRIDVLDTKEFARCMLIDGVLQSSERDHHIYDAALLEGLSQDDRAIIILGGGDGFVAQMALRLNPALQISIVELDAEVVSASKRHFAQAIFDHPNVKVHLADALTFLRRNGHCVDGIVCDLTDNPMMARSPNDERNYVSFFEQLIPSASAHLRSGAWLSLQGGASFATNDYLQTSSILQTLVARHFHQVSTRDVFVPSFGEENRFILARRP